MRYIIVLASSFILTASFAQESLLLGEQKSEDVYFEKKTDGVEKIIKYISKYKKKGNYKDSIMIGFEDYNPDGTLKSKTAIRGKGDKKTYQQFKYEYANEQMISFLFMQSGRDGSYGRNGKFEYDSEGRLALQEHSMANIRYDYHEDGRMKTKSYFYNNKGADESKPWVNYYLYDSLNHLKHVDTDPNSTKQTTFYNEKNELVKNDYYPGVAYSTYKYDEKGNCTEQVDYEVEKKGWDSITYIYTYMPDNKIATSGTKDKKGRIWLSEEHVYLENGNLKSILYYRKNKRKTIKKFFYEYPKE
jgi:hypothetical protein